MSVPVADDVIGRIHAAFCADDVERVRQILDDHPALKARINEPVAAFDSPAIVSARSRAMVDVLLDAGADLNAKSRWWAGGFGILHMAPPDVAAYAIERGAIVDVHAAARLGLIDRLRALITADLALVHARGGDGQTPLHFASNVEIAAYLLEHGADIDAHDVDHESTPAQYMVRDRHEVARYLVGRGCQTDVLMASALGDLDLVRRLVGDDADAIRMRVSPEHFPMVNGKAGGTIYQWTLGWYVSAHQVARDFGHEHVFRYLMERSPDEIKLTNECWLGDEAMVSSLLAAEPDLAARLDDLERRQLAHAARNNNLGAVRLMLASGLPVDASGQHGGTPLHWAAFHGNVPMVKLLLDKNPPLELTDFDFQATPLGWAIHGSEHGWNAMRGNYEATVELLLRAGAKPPQQSAGSAEVGRILERRNEGPANTDL